MAPGKRRRQRQLEAFVAASDLPKSPPHSSGLNRLLAANDFGAFVDKLWAPLLRSELTERSFADVCDTGGAR